LLREFFSRFHFLFLFDILLFWQYSQLQRTLFIEKLLPHSSNGMWKNMRSSFEIIAEILETAKEGAKKTRIMYRCGLSYRFVQKYLNLLLETGLLSLGNSYQTTEKGMGFLKKYQRLELLMNTTC
jgi:predicted transcriptional regulator